MDEADQQDFQDPPEGWRKVVRRRKTGRTAGKYDIYYYDPSGIQFRSRIALEKHLEKIGSSLHIDQFNFQQSKESAETDTHPEKRRRFLKDPHEYFKDVNSSLPVDQFNFQHSNTFETYTSPPITKRRPGRKKRTLKEAPSIGVTDAGSSLPIDQYSSHHSMETFETNKSAPTQKRRPGRKKRTGKEAPSIGFNNAGSSLPIDQFSSHHSMETFETNKSAPTEKRRRGRKKRSSKKALRKYFNDVGSSLPLDQFNIQHNKKTFETNTSTSSTEISSTSLPCTSEVNEDLSTELMTFISSFERYSKVLLFLIPLDPHLDQVCDPVCFQAMKNCTRTGVQLTFLAANAC